MAYIKDARGCLHKDKGLCNCGNPGTYLKSVVVPGKGFGGSNKPLAVYVCNFCRKHLTK